MINRNWKYWVSAKAIIISSVALLALGCDDRNDPYYPSDNTPPPVPSGVGSITMDHSVKVYWDAISMDPQDDDLDGYRVYISNDDRIFEPLADVDDDVTEYTVTDLVNGRTYYFAVTSYDRHDNESELSLESVYDTPRPEGFNQTIYSFNVSSYEHISGFDFVSEVAVPWNHRDCDFYMEYDTTLQTFYLWLADDNSLIQDMGYTDYFDEISYAPNSGWSNFSYVEAIVGHTYVILTADNHYAKVRINQRAFDPSYLLIFDWGYQVDPGNRELKIEKPIRLPIENDEKAFY